MDMYLFRINVDCKPTDQISVAVEFGVGISLEERVQEHVMSTADLLFIHHSLHLTPMVISKTIIYPQQENHNLTFQKVIAQKEKKPSSIWVNPTNLV